MKVIATLVSTTRPSDRRPPVMEGDLWYEPELGYGMIIECPDIQRTIMTSPVTEIDKITGGHWRVHTTNSLYDVRAVS